MSWTDEARLALAPQQRGQPAGRSQRGVDGEDGAGLVGQRVGEGGELGCADAGGLGQLPHRAGVQLLRVAHRVAVRIARTPTHRPTAAVRRAAAKPYSTVRSMVPANSVRSASTT